MQSMVQLPTPRLVHALLALLVTPQSLQSARWATPLALVALAVIMEHPLLLVPLMMDIQLLDAKPVLVEPMLRLVQERHAPPALLDVTALAQLTNAQELALLDVTALARLTNAQVLVRSDHTQLVVQLLYLVHLAAQAKLLLQQVAHLPQTVSVLLATLALAVMHA